jgi:hypothetical protein
MEKVENASAPREAKSSAERATKRDKNSGCRLNGIFIMERGQGTGN